MTLLVRMYPCRFANHAHHILKLYEKGVLIVALQILALIFYQNSTKQCIFIPSNQGTSVFHHLINSLMQPGCHNSKVVSAGQHQISQMLLSAFPSLTMSHKPFWPKYSKSYTQSLTELPRKSPLTRLIKITNNMIGRVNEYTTMHYFINPGRALSMIAYMILTEYFWKVQRKIELWECC